MRVWSALRLCSFARPLPLLHRRFESLHQQNGCIPLRSSSLVTRVESWIKKDLLGLIEDPIVGVVLLLFFCARYTAQRTHFELWCRLIRILQNFVRRHHQLETHENWKNPRLYKMAISSGTILINIYVHYRWTFSDMGSSSACLRNRWLKIEKNLARVYSYFK